MLHLHLLTGSDRLDGFVQLLRIRRLHRRRRRDRPPPRRRASRRRWQQRSSAPSSRRRSSRRRAPRTTSSPRPSAVGLFVVAAGLGPGRAVARRRRSCSGSAAASRYIAKGSPAPLIGPALVLLASVSSSSSGGRRRGGPGRPGRRRRVGRRHLRRRHGRAVPEAEPRSLRLVHRPGHGRRPSTRTARPASGVGNVIRSVAVELPHRRRAEWHRHAGRARSRSAGCAPLYERARTFPRTTRVLHRAVADAFESADYS